MDLYQQFREIAELNLRPQYPFTEDKLRLLGEASGVQRGMAHLDLGCGKGDLLNLWAIQHQTQGVGVDVSEAFIQAATRHADEHDLLQAVTYVVDEPLLYPSAWHSFDIVSNLSPLGAPAADTLQLMQTALRDHTSLLMYGETFWLEPPTPTTAEAVGVDTGEFRTLAGLLDTFEGVGGELVEMVLADRADWDRYEAQQWMALSEWLNANPDHPNAGQFQAWVQRNRRHYLQHGRRHLGWGVFVLRVPGLRG